MLRYGLNLAILPCCVLILKTVCAYTVRNMTTSVSAEKVSDLWLPGTLNISCQQQRIWNVFSAWYSEI